MNIRGPLIILSQYLKTKHLISHSSRIDIEQRQEKKVIHLLNHILPRSPFYQKHLSGYSLKDWRRLPTINKETMMDAFDTLNTVGITKKEAFKLAFNAEKTRDFSEKIRGITVGLSSGTSGNRGLFLVSEEEQWRWVGTLLAKVLPGPLPLHRTHRLALFLRANSDLYRSVGHGRIGFHFFDLFNPIKDNAMRVNQYQPTILVAPPSMLRFLASYQKQGIIHLRPEKIISVAEVLDPLDKHMIQETFHQQIHQIYQCTEGFLGITCPYGTLHVNEDLIVMEKEYLDTDTEKFSPIITDFTRVSQPIIRYLLNDILTERKTPCPCGSAFLAIEQIEGRCDDIFYLQQKDSHELKPIFPDFIRSAVLSAHTSIEEYLVIQHSPQHIEIQLKLPKEKMEKGQHAVITSIQSLLQKQSCMVPHISQNPYTQETGTKKLRRIQRRFSPPISKKFFV